MLGRWFGRRDFAVTMRGRDRLVYTEGKRRLHLDGEAMASGGPVDIVFFFLHAHAWDSPPGMPVTEAEKTLIKDRIEARLKENGLTVEVEL